MPSTLSRLVWFTALIIALLSSYFGYNYYESLGKALETSPLSFYDNPFTPTSDPSRRAYATTLYDEHYVPGAILLGYSLKKHGMLDSQVAQTMLLLHTPGSLGELSMQLLQEVGWTLRTVNHIPPPIGRPPAHNFMDQYTKLRLFELDDYDMIFYLDADMMVVRPFSEIWSFPVPLAATRDVRMGYGWLPSINAGSLLLKPNRRLLSHMLEIAPTYKYNYVFAEQGLLNAYWARDITILPYIYNGQLGIKRVFPKIWERFKDDVKIIHYTGLKPWQWYEKPDMPVERELWWREWEEMLEERKAQDLVDISRMGRNPREM